MKHQEIRRNAAQFLEAKGVESAIRKLGNLFYTGSYALDLMTWNDIDIQVVFDEQTNPMDGMTTLLGQFVKDPDFLEGKIIHFRGDYKPMLPRGIYLGIHWGGFWKMDLWALEKADFDRNRVLIETLLSKLNEKNRKLILELKREMMAGEGRVPPLASHFLYQAVLIEGMQDKEAIYRYIADRK